MKSNAEIFLSYAWNNQGGQGENREKLVNQLYTSLLQDGFNVIKDKNDLEYNGSINKFISRLSRANCIVVAISDKYLKSTYCMFELCEIARYSHFDETEFREKVLPLKVEAISFNDQLLVNGYVTHWKNEYAKWLNIVKEHAGDVPVEYVQRCEKIKMINLHFLKLIGWLADSNTLNIQTLLANDFAEIKKAILKKNSTNTASRWKRIVRSRVFLCTLAGGIAIFAIAAWYERSLNVSKTPQSIPALYPKTIALRGYVKDSVSGKELEEAEILVYDNQKGLLLKYRTDKTGYFDIGTDSVNGNKIDIRVYKKDYTGNEQIISLNSSNTAVLHNILLVPAHAPVLSKTGITESKIQETKPVVSLKNHDEAVKVIPTVINPIVMCKVVCDTKGYTGIEVSVEDLAHDTVYTQVSKGGNLVFTVPCDLLNGTYKVNYKKNGLRDYRTYYRLKEFSVTDVFDQ